MSETTVMEGAGFSVQFHRQGDRFVHRISLTENSESPFLLAMVEGHDEKLWPDSPALQQLHFEERPDGTRTAMLVGMSGSSHFSLSCEIDQTRGHLRFDVAARIKKTPEHLGSLYQLAEGSCFDAENQRLTGGVRVITESSILTSRGQNLLEFSARPISDRLPVTVSWRYSFARDESFT